MYNNNPQCCNPLTQCAISDEGNEFVGYTKTKEDKNSDYEYKIIYEKLNDDKKNDIFGNKL